MLFQEYYDNIVHDFSYAMLTGVTWAIFLGVLNCAICSKSVETTLNMLFFVQSCLQPLKQLCIGFWHVQCCPMWQCDMCKSFKTALNRIFSCAMLSGASGTILHKVFPVQMCPRSIKTTFYSLSDNIAKGFDLCNVAPGVLRQHCTRFFLLQCCLEPLGQYCIG